MRARGAGSVRGRRLLVDSVPPTMAIRASTTGWAFCSVEKGTLWLEAVYAVFAASKKKVPPPR